jgi:REase_MTES_1575
VDFAATHPEDAGRMVLAIEADGASYRESGSVRDRDRLRGEHLQRLGWRFHRLWSTNWFQDPQAEVAKVRDAYDRAVSATDPAPEEAAEPAAAAPHADPPAAAPQAVAPQAAAPAAESAANTGPAGTPAVRHAGEPPAALPSPSGAIALPGPSGELDRRGLREVRRSGG